MSSPCSLILSDLLAFGRSFGYRRECVDPCCILLSYAELGMCALRCVRELISFGTLFIISQWGASGFTRGVPGGHLSDLLVGCIGSTCLFEGTSTGVRACLANFRHEVPSFRTCQSALALRPLSYSIGTQHATVNISQRSGCRCPLRLRAFALGGHDARTGVCVRCVAHQRVAFCTTGLLPYLCMRRKLCGNS